MNDSVNEVVFFLCRKESVVGNIFSSEALLNDFAIVVEDECGNVCDYLRSSGCGNGHNHGVAQFFQEIRNGSVCRTEVVSPLRNAMRFINGYERNVQVANARNEVIVFQAFWRDVKEFVFSVGAVVENFFNLEII